MAAKGLTRSSGHRMLLNTEFRERSTFTNGKLPSHREVLEMLLFRLNPLRTCGHRSRSEVYYEVARSVESQWIHSNVIKSSKIHLNRILMTVGLHEKRNISCRLSR